MANASIARNKSPIAPTGGRSANWSHSAKPRACLIRWRTPPCGNRPYAGDQPAFVLLDEPFAGVDPIAVIDIQRIIQFLTERGIGVLITDHNVRETLGICDRAYIISDGTVVLAEGDADAIVNNEAVRRVYLGEHFFDVRFEKNLVVFFRIGSSPFSPAFP